MNYSKQFWGGGKWEGSPKDSVEIWCRGGYNDTGRAMDWDWEHTGDEGDILFYQVLEYSNESE